MSNHRDDDRKHKPPQPSHFHSPPIQLPPAVLYGRLSSDWLAHALDGSATDAELLALRAVGALLREQAEPLQ